MSKKRPPLSWVITIILIALIAARFMWPAHLRYKSEDVSALSITGSGTEDTFLINNEKQKKELLDIIGGLSFRRVPFLNYSGRTGAFYYYITITTGEDIAAALHIWFPDDENENGEVLASGSLKAVSGQNELYDFIYYNFVKNTDD